ncbi:autoinducer binding domain-containing protein [Loktanella sp. M215]|uniref:autoinducer binding domain-containing protein n=1 Tax=Loktanella sp. M215 TaxID=2675431 RepID=UPI001F308C26|nr:autoinducer binding domain-containing protein [Loktanella sp. M215]MBU2359374.1 LuxR family transcriptional regulator [Alphaproteobacteria bacterium]MCF7698052.1 LuxR family transcriptional regulator [Loktanella sp. M215]
MNIVDLGTLPATTENYVGYLDQMCAELGLDYASYASVNPVTGAVQGYANYPESWKLHYMTRNLHRIDPTLQKAGLSIAPVDWERFERDQKFRAVFFAAEDFGITSRGLTVPIRGPYGDRGLLSVTRSCGQTEWNTLKRQIMGDLQIAAVHLHDSIMRSCGLTGILGYSVLSSREKEVLQWVAAGKLQQEIGDILSISHRTVEIHLRSAREKLGAFTTIQAVGRAIGMGLIYPQ